MIIAHLQPSTTDSGTSRRESWACVEAQVKTGWFFKAGDTIKNAKGGIEFTIRRTLGRGSYGEVYVIFYEESWNTKLCDHVEMERAMKCTKLDQMTREQRSSLFLPLCEEALLGAKIGTHPNIVALRSATPSAEEFLVVMDLDQGARELLGCYKDGSVFKTIGGGIASWGDTPPVSKITSLLAALWQQLLSALDHLHGLKIMHSDIKPENALLNADTLQVYVFDLGLAREGRVNLEGVFEFDCDGCTPAYAGPEVLELFEQFEDGMAATERASLQRQHPIAASSHGLWAAALSIFEAVFSNMERSWNKGGEGPDALSMCWGKCPTCLEAIFICLPPASSSCGCVCILSIVCSS
jgi:serine/threonine protein kinase